ncbi:MAG: hypothetical protein P8Y13_01525 [Deinococcales bacterium]
MENPSEYVDGPSLSQVLDALRAGLVLALLAGAIAGVVGVLVDKAVPAEYTATTTVLVAQPGADLSRTGLTVGPPAPLDLEVYRRVATSGPVLADAAIALGSSDALQRVRIKVDTSNAASSGVLRVSAEARSPAAASAAANAVADSLVMWDRNRVQESLKNVATILSRQVASLDGRITASSASGQEGSPQRAALVSLLAQREDDLYAVQAMQSSTTGSLQVLERAAAPATPSGPSAPWIAVGGFLLGFFLGYGVFLLRRSIDPRIHHVDQVNRITGLRVLTKLPRKASRSKDYRSAMGLMAARLLLELPQRTSPPVVLVAGLEGGRTRPLSATHLAFAFARNGRRTLLIDANDQAPTLTEVFRLDPAGTTTFTQVLRAPDATVRPARIEGPTGASIDVIPNFGAGSTPRRLIDESLPSVLLGARERYDVIVVDTPPLLQSVNALAVAQSGTATVLVAALHRTHAPALRDAATTLGRTPAAVLGVAVADPSRGPWHFQRVLAWSGSRRSARSVAVDWRS